MAKRVFMGILITSGIGVPVQLSHMYYFIVKLSQIIGFLLLMLKIFYLILPHIGYLSIYLSIYLSLSRSF